MSNTRNLGPESRIIGLFGGSKRQVSGRFASWPQARNLFDVIAVLQKREGVHVQVRLSR
ncbi:MAG: hypothetical protein M3436_12125 [Pseudomonadota bacterium]|nr:hypothetical protein [Pseudomonadota bacterium]